MPDPFSELANRAGGLFQPPKRDQNIPSSSIDSPSHSVSYPQPVYSSSPQLLHQHNTEKLSLAQEFIDNERADLVQNLVLSEHGLSTGMLSTPRLHKLSDVPPVSATVVTPGADNSSKPHRMSLSSLIEKAVGHKLGEKFIFSEQQIMKILPSEHARNISSPVIGAHHVDKLSNIIPLDMPRSQSLLFSAPTNKDQGQPSENTEDTCDTVSAQEAPISATADTSFPSNIISAAPSDEVRPIGASLTPLPPETGVTPLFLPDSPTSSSTPIYKGRGGDEDEENFVNDMLTENPKPGPSRPRIASPVVRSPALTPGDSLFTPPPELPRHRPREILDYVAVPPFPKGLTRADYELSPLGRLARSQSRLGVTVHNSVGDALTTAYTSEALLDSSASSERKGKGRERTAEKHGPPPRKKYKPHVPELFGADISVHSNDFIDLHIPPTVLHLPDVDLDFEPAPSSPQVLQSNSLHVQRRVSEKHSETVQISHHDPFMGTPGGSAGGVLDLGPWNLVDQDHVSPANPPVGPLGGGTIDPSLLGGNELEKPNSQPSHLMSPPRSALSPGPVIYIRRPEGPHDGSAQLLPSSSKLPGKGKRAVQIRYRPTASVQASDGDVVYVPKRNQSTPDSDYDPSVDEESIRISRRSIKPSLKIRLSGASITPTNSKTCPIPDSDAEVAKKIERPLSITKPFKQKGSKLKTPKLEETRTFCHQCRRGSTREKMVCASSRSDGRVCGKYFCTVCVLNRYPEIEFDSSLATWICPYCTATCNCSYCAPKRGEEYISARGGGFAGMQTKSHVVLVRDNGGPSKTHTPPPNAPKLWGTVYGLSGERVGQAYIGDESQPLASRAGPKAKPIRPRKPHVFIGVPQPSWGVKSFKYLDEAADDVPDAMLQGNVKGNAVDGRRARMYIGDRSALYQPFKRMSDLDPPKAAT